MASNSHILAACRVFRNSQRVFYKQQTKFPIRQFSAVNLSFDEQLHNEIAAIKVSPSAGIYLRGFGILPSQLKASGPKGYLQKGDVLAYIKKNDLKRKVPEQAVLSAEKKPAVVVKTKPKKQPQAAKVVGDPNDPFTQTWEDLAVPEERVPILDNIAEAKKLLAHSYMSTKTDVSVILKEFPDVPLDSFVMKAAQKAYSKMVDSSQALTVQRVDNGTVHAYPNVKELRVGQITAENASKHDNPVLIQVYQVKNVVESLPIAEEPTTIALHFSEPELEVVLKNATGPFDIADLDLEGLADDVTVQESDLETAQTVRLTISYDIKKVDDQTAASFLKQLRQYLNQYELMLL